MAIVQISRITNRKGLVENLPQLAGAELGWAIDDRRLFIGNGTLEEGAPIIGNTEILTEFSDILAVNSAYTYQGQAAGYTVQTGATSGSPVSQSLQSWLDQFATVKDFGAVGDGVTDDTDAINRALYEIYCREVNPQIRRALFFPGGQYLVRESIIIPPYARLYGEGANNSVIVLTDGSLDSSLSNYCARFGDSLQQTGVNIGNNGAVAPNNIEIASLGFKSVATTDVFLIEDASYCTFTDVSFNGGLVPSQLTTSSIDITCVEFDSTLSLICNNITFRRCEFVNATRAFSTAEQVNGVLITESKFDTLYQGILLGDPTPINGGPSGFRILGNQFNNIYREGIRIAPNTRLNASGYNIFYDVANHFNGITNPATSVINFFSSENVSIGDMFARTLVYSTVYPRIDLNDTASIGVDSSDRVQQGTYTRQTGQATTLTNNVANQTIFTVNALSTRAFKMEYTIVRDAGDSSSSDVRTGTLTVVASTNGTGINLTSNDDGIENNVTGVSFSVTETASTVSVRYSTTNTGVEAILHYSITHLA